MKIDSHNERLTNISSNFFFSTKILSIEILNLFSKPEILPFLQSLILTPRLLTFTSIQSVYEEDRNPSENWYFLQIRKLAIAVI